MVLLSDSTGFWSSIIVFILIFVSSLVSGAVKKAKSAQAVSSDGPEFDPEQFDAADNAEECSSADDTSVEPAEAFAADDATFDPTAEGGSVFASGNEPPCEQTDAPDDKAASASVPDLTDADDARRAIIMSEIINRKY